MTRGNMAGNFTGNAFRVMTFGESHGPAVGVVIDGVSPGLELTEDIVRARLEARRPGTSGLVSPRQEPDVPEILSGVFEGRTTGAPICIVVRNSDANPEEYRAFAELFRPGHGDHSWLAKYGIRDWRGGGRQSGRETVGRVAAGAVARQILNQAGITVRAHVVEIAGIKAEKLDWSLVASSPVRCGDSDASVLMEKAIRDAMQVGESVGGIVEIVAQGVPAGLGEPVFGKLDAELARALMSIGAVKGVEIGEGFGAAGLRGSAMVDQMNAGGYMSNHAGGILAGVSNGMPIVCRIAVKPTPSVRKPLLTVDLSGSEVEFTREGRSDPCICPRIVPVAESMVEIVLADALMPGTPKAATSDSVDPVQELDSMRALIDDCDAAIIEQIAERLDVAAYIGELKRQANLAVTDPAREIAVRARWHSLAAESDIPADLRAALIDGILDLLLTASRKVQ